MARFWPSRLWRQVIRWSLACLLLIFAGLVICLQAERLGVGAELVWLGQNTLAPGTPAAQRAWAIGPDQRPASITSARLSLHRDWRGEELCAFSALRGAQAAEEVIDLNFQLPLWPAGVALMRLELETSAGPLRMEQEVILDPVIRGQLSLWPPSREFSRAPMGLATSPQTGREGMLSRDGPVAFQLFPLGGRLQQDGDEAWVRVLDRQARAVAGRLQTAEQQERAVDEEGFALLQVAGPVGLRFESPAGCLEQRLELASESSPGRLRARRTLLGPGERLDLNLAGLAEAGRLHWDLWWLGGWAAGGRADFPVGGGNWSMALPAGLEGPILLRLRRRPQGDDAAARAFALLGRQTVPGVKEAWRLLELTPRAEGAADELEQLGRGPVALAAALSRLRAPPGPLPELGRDRSRGKRPAMRAIGWALFGAGFLGLSGLAIWLWARRRARRVDRDSRSA